MTTVDCFSNKPDHLYSMCEPAPILKLPLNTGYTAIEIFFKEQENCYMFILFSFVIGTISTYDK